MPAGGGALSFWYLVRCQETASYDWATATLRDNVTGITATVLPRTCTNTGQWVRQTYSLAAAAGHSVTLTLANRDGGTWFRSTYTLFDDVAAP